MSKNHSFIQAKNEWNQISDDNERPNQAMKNARQFGAFLFVKWEIITNIEPFGAAFCLWKMIEHVEQFP